LERGGSRLRRRSFALLPGSRRIEGWLTELLYGLGAGAEALRARALARVTELGVDMIGAGPDSRSDEDTRRALFS